MTTTNGGTVVLAADGTFTYDPAAGFTGPDTFFYRLTNAAGSDVGQVTITVSGTLTRAAVNGVATFSGLSIATAGSNYQLVASGPGLAAASSNTFMVTP